MIKTPSTSEDSSFELQDQLTDSLQALLGGCRLISKMCLAPILSPPLQQRDVLVWNLGFQTRRLLALPPQKRRLAL